MIDKLISHYKILEELGRGGMGTVYKAQDTRLDRFVALKFLPHHLSQDEENKKRFIHEAKAASALNHPNIATIYEIDEADGQMFIAMEYIEGTPLIPPLARGETGGSKPLPLDEALNYAIQIAEGLAKAHEKGIIHRDIKPANILVTEDGVVKIVDFGLAKLAGATRLTKDGTSMGTVAYMSPEQTQGAEVDHRTDIWALGVVLYEMLTGQHPFKGDYEQAVIYSILNEEPQFPDEIPKSLQTILRKALTKDTEQRYQGAGDFLADIELLQGGQASVERMGADTKPAPAKKLPLLVGGLAVVMMAVAIAYFFLSGGPAPLRIASTRPLTSAPGFEGQPTWSPDGTRIAYTSDESGRRDIWVRQLRAAQSINLTKEDPASNHSAPAWSPDGEWIAFVAHRDQTGLFAIPAQGGYARRILSTGEIGIDAVTWSPDASKLAFVTSKINQVASAIYIVSARGGEKIRLPFAINGLSVQDPAWSPDGRRLAIVEVMGTGTTTSKLWTVKLDGSEPRALTDGTSLDSNPVWSADGKRILFVSNRGGSFDIWWIPLDTNGGAAGPAQALTAGVGVGGIALSLDGKKLAYEKIVQSSSIWSMPMSKVGLLTLKDAKLIRAENSLIERAAISPDGEWLVFDSNRAGNDDIWIMKRDGTDMRQVTTDPAHDWAPTWSPDGQRIAFHSLRSGNRDIWVKPVAGGAAKQLTTDPARDWDAIWSPNGEEIAFTSFRNGGADIFLVSESSGPRQVTFQNTKDIDVGCWSADGDQIAFASLHTGKAELYVVSLKSGETEQLTEGDFQTLNPFAWSRDGKTIYIQAVKETTPEIYAVSTADSSVRKLTDFSIDPSKVLAWATSDGERFYLVFNEHKSDIWIAELEEE